MTKYILAEKLDIKNQLVHDRYWQVDSNKLYKLVSEIKGDSELWYGFFQKELKSHLELDNAVCELLATLHRDGGHYVEKHGIIKATLDAQSIIHKTWIINEICSKCKGLGAIPSFGTFIPCDECNK